MEPVTFQGKRARERERESKTPSAMTNVNAWLVYTITGTDLPLHYMVKVAEVNLLLPSIKGKIK